MSEGEAYARRTDPAESHIAARSIRSEVVQQCERTVLQALSRHKEGLTSHQITEITGVGYESITPRIRPLKQKGLIEPRNDKDGKPIRRYNSKQPSRVWFLTPKGILASSGIE